MPSSPRWREWRARWRLGGVSRCSASASFSPRQRVSVANMIVPVLSDTITASEIPPQRALEFLQIDLDDDHAQHTGASLFDAARIGELISARFHAESPRTPCHWRECASTKYASLRCSSIPAGCGRLPPPSAHRKSSNMSDAAPISWTKEISRCVDWLKSRWNSAPRSMSGRGPATAARWRCGPTRSSGCRCTAPAAVRPVAGAFGKPVGHQPVGHPDRTHRNHQQQDQRQTRTRQLPFRRIGAMARNRALSFDGAVFSCVQATPSRGLAQVTPVTSTAPAKPAKQRAAVSAAMPGIRRPFRMRHHPQNPAIDRQDAGDVVCRPVGVVHIAEGHPVLVRSPASVSGIGGVIAIVMGNRNADHIARIVYWPVKALSDWFPLSDQRSCRYTSVPALRSNAPGSMPVSVKT